MFANDPFGEVAALRTALVEKTEECERYDQKDRQKTVEINLLVPEVRQLSIALVKREKEANALRDRIETLHDQRHTEARKCDVLAAAIRWALGEGDSDFGDHTAHGAPRYWWRKELRMRAFGKELLLTDEGDEVKVRCPTCGGSNTFDWAYWILWVAFGFLLVSK